MENALNYKFSKPDKSLSDFVESFWHLYNQTDKDKEVVILPDGRIDLIFTISPTEPFHATLLGIGTQPDNALLLANTQLFAISLKPLAAEYILQQSIADLLDNAKNLPVDYWNFSLDDMKDFDFFCNKASKIIHSILPKEIDSRKQNLFNLIYSSNGSAAVKEISEKVFWSSRQINRYFNQQFGLSLKSYCAIIRFRASFEHIKEGKLFPEESFVDQSHFIKEVKKLSGVLPKELKRNQNDRFIQFSTLKKK